MAAKAVVFLLLLLSPPATAAPLEQWRTLFSLSQSLMRRVSTARASRGDLAGAARAQTIADRLDGGRGFWSGVWSMGWDYLRHYSWQDLLFTWPPQEVFLVMTDINQLLAAVNELGRVGSEAGRARWVASNYRRVLSAVTSLLKRLLLAFSRSVSGLVFFGGVGGDVLCVAGEVFDGLRK